MASLVHPDRDAIQSLRLAILDLDEKVSESVKWNAPNFLFDGEDRVTFRLKPGNRFQLILHRGAKVRDLFVNSQSPTANSLVWDGHDNQGAVVPSGVYLYKISVGKDSTTGTVVVAR